MFVLIGQSAVPEPDLGAAARGWKLNSSMKGL